MEALDAWGPWFAGVSLFISTATLLWTARKHKTEQDTAAVSMAKEAVDLHKEIADDRDRERLTEIKDLRARLREMLAYCEENHG